MLRIVPAIPPQEPPRNFEVRNTLGVCIYTSNEPALARRFARINAPRLGDLIIEEVQVIEHRRRLTTVRAAKAQREAVSA